MSGPLNSPLDEGLPPTDATPPKRKKQKLDGWQQLAKIDKLKDVNDYIEGQKDFYRKFLPTGQPISGLTKAERIAAWENAVVIIAEFEKFQTILAGAAASTRK